MTRQWLIKIGLVLAVLAGAGWGVGKLTSGLTGGDSSASASNSGAQMKEFTVRKQTFRVIFTESGKLRAIKNWPISVNIPGARLSISWLAPEGAAVKKGDKLVEFATKEFTDQLSTRQTDLEKQKQQLEVAKSALNISLSTGKSNVAAAQTRLSEAGVALNTYRDLEGPKKLNELDTSINESRAKQSTALKAVAEARRQLDDQIFTEEDQRKSLERELANARETCETTKRILAAFMLQKKIFRQYEYPHQFNSKQQALLNAELELAKAKVSAEQDMKQKTIEVKGAEAQIARQNKEIERLKDYISKCLVTAPVDGLVIYGDTNMPSYYYNEQRNMRVGMDWYGSNVLMTIPDLSAFEVDISVVEEYRGRITEGLPVLVSVEAVPGLSIKGKLKSISQLGRPRGYDYDGQGTRVFASAISLDSTDKRLVSGMTAKVEIVADTVADVLAVPIEALFNEGEKALCYVKEGPTLQKRKVKPGRRNANLVEITEGLRENEVLSLIEPPNTGPTTRPAK